MLAPVASETRSPLSASNKISACSPGGPSPAAASSAEFVAIEPGGVRFVVQSATADVRGGRVLGQVFLPKLLT
jgi:hypothetical protein